MGHIRYKELFKVMFRMKEYLTGAFALAAESSDMVISDR